VLHDTKEVDCLVLVLADAKWRREEETKEAVTVAAVDRVLAVVAAAVAVAE